MDKDLTISPKVTVLMPVYNAERYLAEAIESILAQTYPDFEFLIINDGSTDKSLEIIQSYTDDRIKLICNETNLKLIETLNIGIQNASGEYIVRMDADDISIPKRIEKQVNYLEVNPEIAACGSWIEIFTENNSYVYKPLTEPDRIKTAFLFRTELMHPSVVMRKSILENLNLSYNSEFLHAEDFELFLQVSFKYAIANINEVLLKYRINNSSITQVADKDEDTRAIVHKKIYSKALKYLGIDPDENMLNLHRFIYTTAPVETKTKLNEVYNYLLLLENTNNKFQNYDELALKKELSHQMFHITKKASVLGIYALIFYFRNRYFRYTEKSIYQHFKLLFKCILKYRHQDSAIV